MQGEHMKNPTEVCVEIMDESPRAFRVTDTDYRHGQWIPKSQIELEQDAGPGDTVVITMPEWLAVEKGFV